VLGVLKKIITEMDTQVFCNQKIQFEAGEFFPAKFWWGSVKEQMV
jgi:hypothetical protein